MPEWLMKDENYKPEPDKDTFINKSILSLLGVLSKIRAQSGNKEDMFGHNANLKVAFTLIIVILLSVSKSFTFVVIINVYMLVLLSLMEGSQIIRILRVTFIMGAFTFVILLPSFLHGNSYSSIMITIKVLASITAVNILTHSTRWNSITSTLKRFFIPDIFILVLDITIKYIVLLGDFTLNMLYSLKLRSVGRNKSKYTSLSGIAGTMFIISKEMAEDMYSAMECRGYTGEYRVYGKFKLFRQDFISIAVNVAVLLTFFYFERIQV